MAEMNDMEVVRHGLSDVRMLVGTLEKNQNAHTRRIEELERELRALQDELAREQARR